MNRELRLKLPTVTYLEGEEEKHLEPLEDRVIFKYPIKITTADGVKNGYRKRYCHTPEELSALVSNLRNDYANLSDRMKNLIDLPAQVQEFMTQVRNNLETYRAEQTDMMQRVANALGDLLAGKAKPSGEAVQYIQNTFKELGQRLHKVEERLSPPQQKQQ